jgi:long-chain acyl-CoA synthetase
MLKLRDDCFFARPTLLVSVPRIFNRIVEAVRAKFAQTTGITKYLIDMGVSKKVHSAKTDGTYTNRFYDPLVFSKVRESFGGRIRYLASGSAPINPDVQAFLKAIMCCPYIEGYGQTEDSAAIIFGRAYDTEYGTFSELSVTV